MKIAQLDFGVARPLEELESLIGRLERAGFEVTRTSAPPGQADSNIKMTDWRLRMEASTTQVLVGVHTAVEDQDTREALAGLVEALGMRGN